MQVRQVGTKDGISWYTETFYPSNAGNDASNSTGEYIVLVPSGEGDCYALRVVAENLASRGPYRILTFDTPGFSRTTAPPEAFARVTPQLLAEQIVGLLDKLNIDRASFYGCSSGGAATLALCALYPDRVKCGVVHEVPLQESDLLLKMLEMSDEEILQMVTSLNNGGFIEQDINDGAKKWKALGDEYHARLQKNYVRWVRGYVHALDTEAWELARDPENLLRRPIFWTVGSLNEGADKGEGIWKRDFEAANAAGLRVEMKRLNCLHFPSVTVPEPLADWISECVESLTG